MSLSQFWTLIDTQQKKGHCASLTLELGDLALRLAVGPGLGNGGYQGPEFRKALAGISAQIEVEIVKRSAAAKGFVVMPKRWVVERTLAWLGRCRRLAKGSECLNQKARAFLLMASIRLMVRRLCRS